MKRWPHALLAIGLGLAAATLALAFGGSVRAAPAGTVITNCTQSGLAAALAGGGSISFNCGGPATITDTTPLTISQDATLDGGGNIKLAGNLLNRLFVVNSGVNFTLADITLDNFASLGSDGGAIVNHGHLTVEQATLQDSQTDVNHGGGAIFTDGPLTITGSIFTGDYAGNGGALYANTAGAVVTISGTTFNLNKTLDLVNGFGGAIWVGQGAQVSITGGAIIANLARFGAGLYVSQGATVTLAAGGSPAAVSANTASYAGGGIYESQASVSLTNVQMQSDQAFNTDAHVVTFGGAIDDYQGGLSAANSDVSNNGADYGGGLYVTGGALTLTATTLSHNTAITDGGGLNLSQSLLTLSGGSFFSNTARVAGGGLLLDRSTQVSVTSALVSSNHAFDGAGLYSGQSTTHLSGVTFSDNTAGAGGGAEFDASQADGDHLTFSDNGADSSGGGLDVFDSVVTLTQALLTGNHASQGGGVNVANSGILLPGGARGNAPALALDSAFTLSDSSLSDNAAVSGGGLFNTSYAWVSLQNDSLSGNTAQHGGGVDNLLHGGLVISNTTLSGNSAEYGGGIANETSGVLTLTTSTLSGNTASQFGGGLDAGSGSVLVQNSTLNGNAAVSGGGLYNEAATITLTNATLAENLAHTAGGGLVVDGGSISVGSSLLAGNTPNGNCLQTAGTIASAGYNLSDDGSCATFFTHTGDLNNTAAHLGPLGAHGGPTPTQLPGAGSPAIDAIPSGANGCGTTLKIDQRGFARPFNAKCDTGAVETGYVAPALWLPLARR